MKLSSYLSEEVIIQNLEGNNFNELISNLIEEVSKSNCSIFENKDMISKAVFKREEEASTYLGHGIALPHARIEGFNDIVVAIGFPKNKVEVFTNKNEVETIDMVILILADVLKSKKILKIMSGISRLAIKNNNILKDITSTKSASHTIKTLEEMKIEVDHNIIADDLYTQSVLPAKITNTLEEIATRIIIEQVTGIAVVDEDNNFLGEITERELIAFGMPKHTALLSDLSFLTIGEPFENYILNEKITTIKELYRKNGVVTVDKEASLMEISYLFMNRGVTRIYVVEDNKYLGTIRRSDIIKKILHI